MPRKHHWTSGTPTGRKMGRTSWYGKGGSSSGGRKSSGGYYGRGGRYSSGSGDVSISWFYWLVGIAALLFWWEALLAIALVLVGITILCGLGYLTYRIVVWRKAKAGEAARYGQKLKDTERLLENAKSFLLSDASNSHINNSDLPITGEIIESLLHITSEAEAVRALSKRIDLIDYDRFTARYPNNGKALELWNCRSELRAHYYRAKHAIRKNPDLASDSKTLDASLYYDIDEPCAPGDLCRHLGVLKCYYEQNSGSAFMQTMIKAQIDGLLIANAPLAVTLYKSFDNVFTECDKIYRNG
jgi:hypothetical protein